MSAKDPGVECLEQWHRLDNVLSKNSPAFQAKPFFSHSRTHCYSVSEQVNTGSLIPYLESAQVLITDRMFVLN